ncbi:MAG TPA: hypothetical protein VGC35_05935 [Allosphingosinicella sp.]|jgi:hypothetical protein
MASDADEVLEDIEQLGSDFVNGLALESLMQLPAFYGQCLEDLSEEYLCHIERR